MELKNRKEVRVEIRQRRWTLAHKRWVGGVCCTVTLFIDIYISNKTWETVEESVRWTGRREKKKKNCERKNVQPRQLSLLLVVWY
jgi:hypothetical protein